MKVWQWRCVAEPTPLAAPHRRVGRHPVFLLAGTVLLALLAGLLPFTAVRALPGQAREGVTPAAPELFPLVLVEGEAEVDPRVWSDFDHNGTADCFVRLRLQADLSSADDIADWSVRGQYVYAALLEAAQAQAPILAYARQHGLQAEPRLGNNSVLLHGATVADVQALAARADVRQILANRVYPIEAVDQEPAAGQESMAAGWNLDALDPAAGLYGMQAVQVWQAYEVRGEGIVVANIDTGVTYQHPALDRQYRGNLAGALGGPYNHNYNWYQPRPANCGNGTYPCDWDGHGSGGMGLLVGETLDLSEQTGVAPGATWIACMGCEGPGCSLAALSACMDWMIAPTDVFGNNPNPALRPHIVSNAWGMVAACDPTWDPWLQAWWASGIFPAFSTHSGGSCGTIGSPADSGATFAPGAHFTDGSNLYAGGPSACFPDPICVPGAGEVKPNVNAPTFGRTTSNVPGQYYNLGGESGAVPHAAGAAALLWSANPSLIGDRHGTFAILEASANKNVPPGGCGEPACAVNHIPNYEYGWGYLDAYAAVRLALGPGWLDGTLTELGTGTPLDGITVLAESSGGSAVATSNAAGYYTTTLAAGTYTVTAQGPQHAPAVVTGVVILSETVTTVDLQLEPKGLLYGYVTAATTGAPLVATVAISPTGEAVQSDEDTGYYQVYLAAGTYHATASATGYATHTVAVSITAGSAVQVDLALPDAISPLPDPISISLALSSTGTVRSVVTNNLAIPYSFDLVTLGPPRAASAGQNDILLLGDDVDPAGWQAYRTALATLGLTWDERNLDTNPVFPTASELAPYATVVLFDESIVDWHDPEAQVLADWLTSGGKSMFVTGVDWLWDMANGTPGQGEHNLYVLLGTQYAGDSAGDGIGLLLGLPDDPIGHPFAPPGGIVLAGTDDSSGDWGYPALDGAYAGLIYGPGGDGSNYAALTHYQAPNYRTVWLGVNLHNGLIHQNERNALMQQVMAFLIGLGDVPWFAPGIDGATIAPHSTISWTNYFTPTAAAGILRPGRYEARLRLTPQSPDLPLRDVVVRMDVQAPDYWGTLRGVVTGDRPGGPLPATLVVHEPHREPWTVDADPATGYYETQAHAGTYTVTAAADGYLSESVTLQIADWMTTTHDFALLFDAPEMVVHPVALSQGLLTGQVVTASLTISNQGVAPLTFAISQAAGAGAPSSAHPPHPPESALLDPPALWLRLEPVSGTVPAMSASPIAVTFDAGVLVVPGIHTAHLIVSGNDPFVPTRTVPVTMTAVPGNEGQVVGTVIGTGHCGTERYPLQIDILIQKSGGYTYTVATDAAGHYAAALAPGSYSLTFDAPEHMRAVRLIEVTTGQTITRDVALKVIAPCLVVTPPSFSLALPPAVIYTATLWIGNEGTLPLTWEMEESPGVPWIELLSAAGVTAPDATSAVAVVFDTTALALGETYTTTLAIHHDDSDLPSPLALPVTLRVERDHTFIYLPLIYRQDA